VTRTELEQACYRRLGKNTSSPDTATQTRIRHFLNQRHRRILSMPGMSHLRDTSTTFASVANQSNYTLSSAYAIKRIREITNDLLLQPISMDEYRRLEPDPSSSPGTPWAYAIGNFSDGTFTFYLHPQPSAVITYYVDYTAIVSDFSGDSAEPLLPEEFQFILELGACMDELAKNDDPRYLAWRAEYEDGIKDLTYWVALNASGRPQKREHSQLGPMYPAGT
jgi:hypothetical protein